MSPLAALPRISESESDERSLLEKLRGNRRPVVLTEGGHDVAVVVDLAGYQEMIDEVEMLRDVQRGLADIDAGRVVPHEEVRRLLTERYGA